MAAALGIAVTGAIFQGLVSSRLGDLLGSSGVSAAQQDSISEQLGSGVIAHVPGLDPGLANQVASAGNEAFVYALGSAMTVSAVIALAGAVVGGLAIRAKGKGPATTLEAAEADLNPGGSALAAKETMEHLAPARAGERVS